MNILGYNWGSVSTETMNTQQSFEVTTTAPAGSVVVIEQVTLIFGPDMVSQIFLLSKKKIYQLLKNTKKQLISEKITFLSRIKVILVSYVRMLMLYVEN